VRLRKLIVRDGSVDRGLPLPCDALEWTLPNRPETGGDNENTLLDYHCPRTPNRRILKTWLSLSSRSHYSTMPVPSCFITGKCANGVNDGMRGRSTDPHSSRKTRAGTGLYRTTYSTLSPLMYQGATCTLRPESVSLYAACIITKPRTPLIHQPFQQQQQQQQLTHRIQHKRRPPPHATFRHTATHTTRQPHFHCLLSRTTYRILLLKSTCLV